MKYRQIKINVTPEHYLNLEQEATSSSQTIAQLIRDKLNIDLQEKPRIRKMRSDKKELVKADPQLLYHLSKIGNNLNQITKHINTSKCIDRLVFSLIEEVKEELEKYYDNKS